MTARPTLRFRTPFSGIAGLCVLLSVTFPLRAQMVTGKDMTAFASSLGLSEPRGGATFSIDQLEMGVKGRVEANVLWPGEQPTVRFLVTNKANGTLTGPIVFHVVRYGTRGKPGDVWSPEVFRIGTGRDVSVPVKVEALSTSEITVAPHIPAEFGGYALVADLGERGRVFAASLVRTLPADAGRVQFPTYALDFTWDELMNENVLRLFERLGVKGARVGAGFVLDSRPGYEERMRRLAQMMDWSWRHQVTAMLTIDNGTAPMPLDRPRPWLSPDGRMLDTKDDRAWLPAYDGHFEEWVTRIVSRFGWPRGPVNAVELWNEPWEGISISGWGADIPRFREIYEHMAKGVVAARRDAGAQVLIGGACSSTNTRDKLFADGTNKFLPWLDFVSIHYQPLSADPALEPEWMHRQGPYGRVKVWDTESWIANSEDRVAGVIASMRAQGQDRTAGIYEGNVYDSRNRSVNGVTYPVVQAWPPAAAVAATQKFIGQRPFQRLLFRNGLPWVFVFGGLAGEDDGTLVVLGDLGSVYERDRTLFRNVKLAADAAMAVRNPKHAFRAFDFYGNEIINQGGALSVPLNGHGYFLRTDGRPGTFRQLLGAVSGGHITGYAPVDLAVEDFTAPVASHPELRVRITNVLNRRITGTLSASSTALRFAPLPSITLAPGEAKDITTRITDGVANATNEYAVQLRFDAGSDGETQLAETLQVHWIARRTVKIDGDLSDWEGVLPLTAKGAGLAPSLTQEAWLPFRDFGKQVKAGLATGFLAYDNNFLYFAAKIADDTPEEGMLRFETRDDDQFFYPKEVWDHDQKLTWPAGVRRFSYRKNFEIPSGNEHDNVQIAFNVLPAEKKPLLPFPAGTMPHFMVYADTDYEFALNPVAAEYGGGAEVWRLLAPGMPRKHFFPRQPAAPHDGGPVKTARLVCRREANTRIVEAALPWDEIPDVRERMRSGQTIKFSFRVNNNRGPSLELAEGRSVSKQNSLTFHDDWTAHWANELEFAFEREDH